MTNDQLKESRVFTIVTTRQHWTTAEHDAPLDFENYDTQWMCDTKDSLVQFQRPVAMARVLIRVGHMPGPDHFREWTLKIAYRRSASSNHRTSCDAKHSRYYTTHSSLVSCKITFSV
nr:hypothetical protein CFP56_73205 [Quercus suber]